jgi:mitotic-spindle organizing protein 1
VVFDFSSNLSFDHMLTSHFFVLALLAVSNILDTKLDVETLSICVRLCELGVNPEALALVIQELRKEAGNQT